MKPARIVILATALAAGVGAAWMVAGSKPPQPIRQVVTAPAAPMSNVLVAAKEIDGAIQEGDLRWLSWPKDRIPPGVISETDKPDAIAYYKGFCIRDKIGPGVPVDASLLSPPGQGCSMAAMLPPGKRAIAINIDQQGASTAGGFIRPGDHVDVIDTYKDNAAARAGVDSTVSETILRDIKVLAIGQNIQQQGDERIEAGPNATLELTPAQAEKILLAQRVGQLYLSLRSMADTSTSEPDEQQPKTDDTDVTVVRFGVPSIVHFSVPTQAQTY
jgi:pilus assembly protein CpaB